MSFLIVLHLLEQNIFIANLFLPWGMWFSFGKGNDFISKSQQCLYVSLYAFVYAQL
jgi:hypothetical protein